MSRRSSAIRSSGPGAAATQPPPDPKLAGIPFRSEIEKRRAQADIETQNRKVASEIALAEKTFKLASVSPMHQCAE
jgi:hypothetical protein